MASSLAPLVFAGMAAGVLRKIRETHSEPCAGLSIIGGARMNHTAKMVAFGFFVYGALSHAAEISLPIDPGEASSGWEFDASRFQLVEDEMAQRPAVR